MKKFVCIIITIGLIIFGCVQTQEQPTQNGTNASNEPSKPADECLEKQGFNRDYCYFVRNSLDECNKIENSSLKDECMYRFVNINSQNGYILCLNLTDSRDACLNKTAKEDSVCNMIFNSEIRKSCIDFFHPDPCMNLTDVEYKKCAYEKNKTLLCDDFACLTAIAKEFGNESICNKMNAEKTFIRACKYIVGNSSACEENASDYVMSYCFELVAEFTKNYGYCNLANITLYQDSCYKNLSYQLKNDYLCSLLSYEVYRDDCYMQVAPLLNVTICNKVVRDEERDVCRDNYAKKNSDPRACDVMENKFLRDSCFSEVIVKEGVTYPVEYCMEMTLVDWREQCYYWLAVKSNNSSICENIQYDILKSQCKEKLSAKTSGCGCNSA